MLKIFLILTSLIFLQFSSAKAEITSIGQSLFWDGQKGISTNVYIDGSTSISFINPDWAEKIGYSRSEKSSLRDVWKYDNKGATGKLTINRTSPRSQLDSIVVENKTANGIQWNDITVFGEKNRIIRRTTCRERRCFVISQTICENLAKGSDIQSIEKLSSDIKFCSNLGLEFKKAMLYAKTNGTLDSDFNLDDSKLSSTIFLQKRNMVMGEDIDANIMNLVRYVDECKKLAYFNKQLTTNQSNALLVEPETKQRAETRK